MKSARFAATLILAGLVAACSNHPIQVGRATYNSPRMPVRTLVDTPPAAAVPIPPTPELKPGSVAGLEQLRAGGDADSQLMADSLPPDDVSTAAAATTATDGSKPPATPASASTDGSAVAQPSGSPIAQPSGSPVAQPSNAQPVPAQPAGAQPPAASETVAATDDDPNHLVGLSEADALRLLGKPKSRAETPPSRVWTYSSQNCDLRLFFYPEIGGTSYRTLTYEIDDRDPTDSSRRGCVGGLLKNHAS